MLGALLLQDPKDSPAPKKSPSFEESSFGVSPASKESPASKGLPSFGDSPSTAAADKKKERELYKNNASTGGFPPSDCMAPMKPKELLARNRAERAAARAARAARAASLALYESSFTTGLKPPGWCWAPLKEVLGRNILKKQKARRNLLLLMHAKAV